MKIKTFIINQYKRLHHYVLHIQGKTPEQLWNKWLEELLQDVSEEDRKIYDPVLENQYNYCKTEQTSRGGCGSTISAKMIVTISKKVLDNLEISKFVGIQPMSGPVGLVYKMRYKEQPLPKDEDGNDIEPEEGEDKKMMLEVLSDVVQAQTSKLHASWTLEAAEDLKMHGLDIEKELTAALAAEIAHEITASVIHDISTLAERHDDIPSIKLDFTDTLEMEKLPIYINLQANTIAVDTRRGAGNWIIVPPMVLAVLQSLKSEIFVKTNRKGSMGGISHAGILNETINVFVNVYEDKEILIGYKGGRGQIDTGYYYCPYVLCLASGVVADPKTFQPRIGLMTRNGILTDETSADYYRKIKLAE